MYLTNKKRMGGLNDELSDPLPINIGVPQGTVLGPVFLITYINELFFCASKEFLRVSFILTY